MIFTSHVGQKVRLYFTVNVFSLLTVRFRGRFRINT